MRGYSRPVRPDLFIANIVLVSRNSIHSVLLVRAIASIVSLFEGFDKRCERRGVRQASRPVLCLPDGLRRDVEGSKHMMVGLTDWISSIDTIYQLNAFSSSRGERWVDKTEKIGMAR